jgi:hypothetical protein
MKFTKEEIETARQLKQAGLPWQPSVGHYVWDEADIIKCESPFHDMVFYILDLKHFLRRADTIENLQRDLCWLPTWFDARQVLSELGVRSETIFERLRQCSAIENNTERLVLYQLIQERLPAKTDEPAPQAAT